MEKCPRVRMRKDKPARHSGKAPSSGTFHLQASECVRTQAEGGRHVSPVCPCVKPWLDLGPESAEAPLPKDEAMGRVGTGPLPAASIYLGGRVGNQWRPYTYPGHVADAEYSVDDVLVDVCGDELHLDGPVAPGGLLRPVLHTELGKRPRTGRALVSFITEPFLLSAEASG